MTRPFLYVLAITSMLASPSFAGEPGPSETLERPRSHISKPFNKPSTKSKKIPSLPQLKNGQLNEITEVLPEVATHVRLSSTDVNRIVCPSEIKDVVYSKEKGVEVKISGRNAFVKFLVKKSSIGKTEHSSTPTEFFIVCGGDVYTLIATPVRIPSRTVRLSTGAGKRIKENIALFKSLPFEKKVLTIIEKMYTGDIPESFMVKTVNRPVLSMLDKMEGLEISLIRTVDVEGEGLRGKEFSISIKKGHSLNLSEKDFLLVGLTEGALGISLNKLRLENASDKARLFIVERAVEE